MIAGAVAAAASLKPSAAQEAVTIHEDLTFHTSPHRVYEALLDAKEFDKFSGVAGNQIHREAGGAFSLFGGQILGRNVELVPDRRVIQAWRAASWPEGVYSIARFELSKQGDGARLVFDHTGFPPDLREHLASGWREHYWEPLKKYFGE